MPDADSNAQSSVRKRPSDEPEGSNASDVADVAPPQVKKLRGLEQAHEGADVPETVSEESPVNVEDASQTIKDDTGRGEGVDSGDVHAVDDQTDNIGDENVTKTETEVSEDHPKIPEVKDSQLQPVTGEGGSDHDDGEMGSSDEDGITEEPELTMEDNEDKNEEEGETEVEETASETSTDKFKDDGNDESGSMVVESVDVVSGVSASAGPTEVKPEEPVVDTGFPTTDRARRSLKRPFRGQYSSPVTRSRGRSPRGRARGGRTGRGRGQTPGSQGM
ncbi:uncharacterized protein LOC143592006 [Bidens hawaiensis]|uniref:uncharacterized protein LOC143592006 n=1 Tax=Bidens hawaiensis TaxID=980011 RepID=UPI004049DB85